MGAPRLPPIVSVFRDVICRFCRGRGQAEAWEELLEVLGRRLKPVRAGLGGGIRGDRQRKHKEPRPGGPQLALMGRTGDRNVASAYATNK